jgi:hypothetical protein
MFTRKTILVMATFATLGTAALAATSASARGHGGGHFGGGGHHHWGGGGWGHHRGGGGWGHRFGWGWAGGWRREPDRCWPGARWCNNPRPYLAYGGGNRPAPVAEYSGPPAAQASNPPSPGQDCLAKGYLPDGGVVFTDRCTHEGAVAQHEDGPPPLDPRRAGPGS